MDTEASRSADVAGWPLRCSTDPRRPAVAFCTACVQPYCGRYIGVRPDGRAMCHTCAEQTGVELLSHPKTAPGQDPVLVDGWIRAIGRLILRPQRTIGLGYAGPSGAAIAFGFVATTIGFATTLGWDLTMQGDVFITAIADSVPAATEMTPAQIEQALWFFVPVRAAIRMLGGALLLHLGLRVMTGSSAVDLRSSVRAFALASGPLVLCMVPIVGQFVALVTWISACMAHAQSRYGLTLMKGMMAILPALLFISQFGPRNFSPGG